MKKIEKELDEVEISTSVKIMFSVADILKHWNVSYFHNNFKRSGIINVKFVYLFVYWKVVTCLVNYFGGLAFLAQLYKSKLLCYCKRIFTIIFVFLTIPCLKTVGKLMNFTLT